MLSKFISIQWGIALLVSSILFMLILAFLIRLYFHRAIEHLRKAAKALSRCDFSARVKYTFPGTIGILIKDFNHMAAQLERTTVNKEHLKVYKKKLERTQAKLERALITQRHTEDTYKIIEKKYLALFKASPDAIVVTSFDTGAIFEANKKAEELYGLSREEIIAMNYGDLKPKVHQVDTCGNLKNTEELSQNIYIYHKNGYEIPVEIHSHVVELGNEKIIVNVIHDLTKLKETEGKLEGILSTIADHMTMLDNHYTIVWANDLTKKTFGEAIIGEKCYSAYHKKNEACSTCAAKMCFEDGNNHQHEVEIAIPGGNQKLIWNVTASVAAWDSQRRPRIIVERSCNITEQKKAKEKLKKKVIYEKMLADIYTKALYSDTISIFQNSCLEIIGKAVAVEKAYIFNINQEKGTLVKTFIWVNPDQKQEANTLNSDPLSLISCWIELMNKGKVITYKDIEEFPDAKVQDIHRQHNIKSICAVPLYMKDTYYGFMCFTENRSYKEWLDEDVANLSAAAQIISEISRHKQIEEKLSLLEKEVIEISQRERQQIQQDLHDVLAQHLTGIAFMNKALEQKLAAQSLAEAIDAAKIVKYNNEAIAQVRRVMKALNPIGNDPEGLMLALQELATDEKKMSGISCQFVCKKPVLHYDNAAATHLFCIVQKSINNAIKYGNAKNILIMLNSFKGRLTMSIRNDGLDFLDELNNNKSLGLDIMKFRSKIIGAIFTVKRNLKGETITIIHFKRNPWVGHRNVL